MTWLNESFTFSSGWLGVKLYPPAMGAAPRLALLSMALPAALLAGDGGFYVGIEGGELAAVGVHGRAPSAKRWAEDDLGCPGERRFSPALPDG